MLVALRQGLRRERTVHLSFSRTLRPSIMFANVPSIQYVRTYRPSIIFANMKDPTRDGRSLNPIIDGRSSIIGFKSFWLRVRRRVPRARDRCRDAGFPRPGTAPLRRTFVAEPDNQNVTACNNFNMCSNFLRVVMIWLSGYVIFWYTFCHLNHSTVSR